VLLARIPKRLRFYEDAAKVVQKRMVPNFRKSRLRGRCGRRYALPHGGYTAVMGGWA